MYKGVSLFPQRRERKIQASRPCRRGRPDSALSLNPCIFRLRTQPFIVGSVCAGMRLRLLIYAMASVILLAFYAPAKAITTFFSNWQDL